MSQRTQQRAHVRSLGNAFNVDSFWFTAQEPRLGSRWRFANSPLRTDPFSFVLLALRPSQLRQTPSFAVYCSAKKLRLRARTRQCWQLFPSFRGLVRTSFTRFLEPRFWITSGLPTNSSFSKR